MRAAGRIAAAIDVLADVEARRRPVSEALKDWGLSHRFAGSGDRAAIGNLVYDALRWRRSSAWRADADTPRGAVLGTLRFRWGVGSADLETLAGERHGPGVLTDAEQAALSEDRLGGAPDAVRADVPDWVAGALAGAFGDWVAEAAAFASRAPVDLRVNMLKTSREKVLAHFAREGAEATPLSPVGVRLPPRAGWERAPAVTTDEMYLRGQVELQDEGSQVAALLAGAAPGDNVLDLCAGAGGKTLALSAAMDNRGQVHATDADAGQLAPIYERLKRAGTRNVQVHAPASDLSALEARMDRVVVDAPCSGSGTWRRRPETKWRLTAEAVARRIVQQREILDRAATFIRPGGVLAYITCSVLPEENGAQVAGFLQRHGEFRAVDAGVGLDALGGAGRAAVEGGAITLTPALSGTDGFFVALLARAREGHA